MPTRSSKPHRDLNQLAKFIVNQASGEAPKEEPPHVKNEAAVALGKLGGKKGGAARAKALTPEQPSEIAKKAAAWRWRKGETITTPQGEAMTSAPQTAQPKGKRRIAF